MRLRRIIDCNGFDSFFNINESRTIFFSQKEPNQFIILYVLSVILKTFPELKDYKNRKQVRSIQVITLENFDEIKFVEILKNASKLIDKTKRAWNL
ncbi:MAG: hypothetical protein ACI8QP_000541 [Porticoccaceae bacterium]|jgi:hypothetical protein